MHGENMKQKAVFDYILPTYFVCVLIFSSTLV